MLGLVGIAAVAAASMPRECQHRDTPSIDPMYSEDHLNYLCMNYSRPTPLPCKPIVDRWKPRWWDRGALPPRFVIYSWWPPNPAQFKAYAEAGFNMALTGNALGDYCARKGKEAVVTHDELFEAIVAASDELAKLGIMSVFNTDNMCNEQLFRSPTVAYGNKTGGIIESMSNITARAPNGIPAKTPWPGIKVGKPASKGQTIPEMEYITKELTRRGKLEQFAGIQMHDDTLLLNGELISTTQWLKEHAPTFLPFYNQVAPGPETLARTEALMYAPEQYAINCPNSNCSDPTFNATASAMQQLSAYAANAWNDARFGLHSWPLFHMGDGNGPLHNGSLSPDHAAHNTRSDSLVRFMAYSAVAYGAKALNYYCWGGGVWWYDTEDYTKPGQPSPSYQTVVEVNADVGPWGDELLAGGFRFSGALHTGFTLEQDGSGTPSERAAVVAMSDDLLVGVFVPAEDMHDALDEATPSAYLFVVDKRVSGELAQVPARNVTLSLHPSVASATVVPPGWQGQRGFDELRARHRVERPPERGPRRRHYAHVEVRGGIGRSARVVVTLELVGGGGGLVRLFPASGKEAELHHACVSFVRWTYAPAEASLSARSATLNFGLKQGSWEYDNFPASYRPYAGLELTAGRSFEDGEQSSFVIGASFHGAAAPVAADEAKAWAWAGYNLLSVEAPSAADLASYGNASAAVGAVLDAGSPFGFFVIAEPSVHSEPSPSIGAVFTPMRVAALSRAFRCHARWGGLALGINVSDGTQADSVVAAAAALRTYARGNWLLPFAGTPKPSTALSLGKRGVPLPMVEVAPFTSGTATAWAQAVAAQYEPFRAMLAASYHQRDGIWVSDANNVFVASLDACASDSDSMLRWSAFAALAYGARGLFWRGAGRCAPDGSPKFGLLASINKRILQWGNTFVPNWRNSDFPGGGYNVTRLWSTGFALPYAVAPGSSGPSDLVQAADPDVLVARLGDMGIQPRTSLIYVVDQRVDATPGAARPRQLKVVLRGDVQSMQPVEGDCAASRCQCGLSLLGSTLHLKLPGGSGQLVALVLESDK